MSHFVDYCDEIEKARKQGFGRVVLPAAISLPDICGGVEYPELKGPKNVGERYKRWIKEYLKGVCPIEETLVCVKCRSQADKRVVCKDDCPTRDSAYIEGMANLADRLYGLRNNLTHEGNMTGEHYLFDVACSDAEFPIQGQAFVNGKWQYGKPVVNMGSLIFSLCIDAVEYYNGVDEDKKKLLDTFDKEVFHSDNMKECLNIISKQSYT